MPFLTLDGVRFHYQQSGSGPDVVLIHAVTANLAVWMFTDIVTHLADEFRVTMYDLRGHGYSDAPPTGYTSADMADDFRKLHVALGLGPAWLVGHSYGGVIATHVAATSPELVRGVILSDSYFPGLAHLEPNLPNADVWRDLQRTFAAAGLDIGDEVNFDRLFVVVAGLTDEQSAAVKASLGPSGMRWLGGLTKLADTTCGKDAFEPAGLTAEVITSVQQPVVAMYDEHSPFLATCRFLEANLPRCTVEIVPGAKHLAPLENTVGFNAAVKKHLLRWKGLISEPGRKGKTDRSSVA